MANIRIDLDSPVYNGQALTFKSPADCSEVTGIVLYYYEEGTQVSAVFTLTDAHGNNVAGVSLFAANVLVKVILDIEFNKAFVQNADTNAYLEARLENVPKLFHTAEQPQEAGPWIWLQSIRSRELGVDTVLLELSKEEPQDGDVVTEIDGTEYTVENASTDPNVVGEGEYLFDINK